MNTVEKHLNLNWLRVTGSKQASSSTNGFTALYIKLKEIRGLELVLLRKMVR